MTDSVGPGTAEPPSGVTQLEIVWLDPPDPERSFPLDHAYVELVYAPLIGASAVLFLRRVALLASGSTTIVVDPAVMANELGVRSRSGAAIGKNSPFVKALHRLERYQLALWLSRSRLGIYRRAPSLAAEHRPKLPVSARRAHDRYVLGDG